MAGPGKTNPGKHKPAGATQTPPTSGGRRKYHHKSQTRVHKAWSEPYLSTEGRHCGDENKSGQRKWFLCSLFTKHILRPLVQRRAQPLQALGRRSSYREAALGPAPPVIKLRRAASALGLRLDSGGLAPANMPVRRQMTIIAGSVAPSSYAGRNRLETWTTSAPVIRRQQLTLAGSLTCCWRTAGERAAARGGPSPPGPGDQVRGDMAPSTVRLGAYPVPRPRSASSASVAGRAARNCHLPPGFDDIGKTGPTDSTMLKPPGRGACAGRPRRLRTTSVNRPVHQAPWPGSSPGT